MSLGLEPVTWLTDRNWAFAAAVGVSVWAHMGFYTLILLAGLQAIPKDLYEAAEMDGTRPARVFWRITLPLLAPNLLVVLVLALIRAVQIFDEVYVLTGGGPGTSTLFLTQYIYEIGFASLLRNPGLAAAASILMGAVLVVLTLIQLGIGRRGERRGHAMSAIASSSSAAAAARGWHWTDVVTWVWLIGGLLLMFGPAVWLVGSSFKTPAALAEFPPTILPYVTADGDGRRLRQAAAALRGRRCRTARPSVLAEVRRIGIVAQMVDPANPGEIVKVNIADRKPLRDVDFAIDELHRALPRTSTSSRYLWNSVFVTVMATLITLITNSMAAFALSQVPVPRPLRRDAADPRDADGAALGHHGAALLGHLRARPLQLALGRHPADGGDADRRVHAAPVHADHPRRADRRGAHGQGLGVADLLAHHPAADRAGAGRARHLLGGLALERLPLAADRAVAQGALHAAGRRSTPIPASSTCSGTSSWP